MSQTEHAISSVGIPQGRWVGAQFSSGFNQGIFGHPPTLHVQNEGRFNWPLSQLKAPLCLRLRQSLRCTAAGALGILKKGTKICTYLEAFCIKALHQVSRPEPDWDHALIDRDHLGRGRPGLPGTMCK